MKVAVIPPPAEENPWQRRLYGALGQYGITVVRGELKPWWPWLAANRIDMVHLHWLEYVMVSSTKRFVSARAVAAATSIAMTLRELRRRRMPVVWTLHNPEPHRSPTPAVHRWLNRQAAELVDVVIVHSEFAAAWARSHLSPPGEIVVAHHPNYVGEYPTGGLTAAQVRGRYGIPPESFLLLVFGAVHRYKHVPEVLEVFAGVADPEARLLVIGYPADDQDVTRVIQLAQADPRVTLDLHFAADEDVSALFEAADYTIINYEVFSSGVMLLALSFGCPVIAPRTGAAAEIASAPACLTFEPGRLGAVLSDAAAAGRSPAQRRAARAAAETFTPDLQARDHLRAYEIAARAAQGRG